ncbi:MAG: hypothetical protein E4H20_10730 [Spirochaetales bacterium]|nr:MAG: hypothetical protein E4H20_10730 [Spirochaetales bacterium]
MIRAYETFLKPFTRPYATADLRIRKKARILAPASAVIGLFGLLLCGLMAVTGAFTVAAFLVGLTVFCAIVLMLMARGNYRIASSLFLYGLFLVMFAAIKFDDYRTIYECYVFGTLGSFLLILAGLIATSRMQVYALTVLDLAAIAILYISDALPLDAGTITPLAMQSLGTSSILILVGGLFSAIVVRMQRTLVDESERSAFIAERQFQAMAGAVQKAQESAWSIGSQLSTAADVLSDAARELSGIATEESLGVASLDEALVTGAESNANVAAGQERVGSTLNEYSARVLGTSISISKMLRSLQEISEAADERKSGVADLAILARDGEERVSEVARSIDGIVKAAERMNEMNSVIGDVANRTNLLGMNASIEAAHAGASGRGFGVVAGEIRKLSEEAATSSQAIARLLSDTGIAVKRASTAGSETSQFFGRMSEEIQLVSGTLGDLLRNLGELSSGTAGISDAVEGFKLLADSAGKASEAAMEAMRESSTRSAVAREVAANLHTGIDRVSRSCENLLAQARTIQSLGRENATRMEELKNSLSTQ